MLRFIVIACLFLFVRVKLGLYFIQPALFNLNIRTDVRGFERLLEWFLRSHVFGEWLSL